ncbi:MAG: hypothetical protein ACRDQH_19320, partial [Pseudonocardiaceae bacterium]
TLRVIAAGATGRVAYRLQRDRGGHWQTLDGTRRTDGRGHATVRLSAALANTPPNRLRVMIRPQPTWRYLTVKENA